jgi:transcriptional regulator with XRE-family HTH domain
MSEDKPRLKIGSRIRQLRLSQRRTQQEIADSAGFTKSLLSKIESGRVVPPVATLVKIAEALGTNVSSIIESGKHLNTVATAPEQAGQGLTQTERGYWIYPFAAAYRGKKMQPMLIVARKGEVKEHHLSHRGEEFIYVLEGAMWVEVGEEKHRLEAGGSVYFNSTEVHQVIPITKEAKYLNIFL